MAISQSLRNRAVVIEKYVTLGATSGTTVGVAVPAGTLVLAAGFEPDRAVPSVTTYTMNLTDGTTTFASALNFNNTAAGTIKLGTTAGLVSVNDTIDVVTTISGSPGTVAGRVFVVAIDVNESVGRPDEVKRDQFS